jgi:hypothetical protein
VYRKCQCNNIKHFISRSALNFSLSLSHTHTHTHTHTYRERERVTFLIMKYFIVSACKLFAFKMLNIAQTVHICVLNICTLIGNVNHSYVNFHFSYVITLLVICL